MELDSDSTGYLSLGSLDDKTPDTYQVRNWTLRDWDMSMKVVPASADAEPVKIDKCECYPPNVEIHISGVTNDWSRKATLWNERDFKDSAKRAANAISKARKKR